MAVSSILFVSVRLIICFRSEENPKIQSYISRPRRRSAGFGRGSFSSNGGAFSCSYCTAGGKSYSTEANPGRPRSPACRWTRMSVPQAMSQSFRGDLHLYDRTLGISRTPPCGKETRNRILLFPTFSSRFFFCFFLSLFSVWM